jgi:hypothetical protein
MPRTFICIGGYMLHKMLSKENWIPNINELTYSSSMWNPDMLQKGIQFTLIISFQILRGCPLVCYAHTVPLEREDNSQQKCLSLSQWQKKLKKISAPYTQNVKCDTLLLNHNNLYQTLRTTLLSAKWFLACIHTVVFIINLEDQYKPCIENEMAA